MAANPWYPWYASDAKAKMAGLSFAWQGAYRLLLDHYYITGGPLPSDQFELYRITSAVTQDDKEIVDGVVKMFFLEKSGRLHNKRADKEIAKRQALVKAGRKGGLSRVASQRASRMPSESLAPQPQLHPQPELELQEEGKTLSGNTNGHRQEAMKVLDFLNTKANRAYRPTEVNLELIIARLKEGASLQDCKSVIAKKVREWSVDDKMKPYLRPATLFNRQKFSQYVGELVETPDA